jgi:hypothetical protein
VPELSLDDDQRHAIAGHLDGMGVARHGCRVAQSLARGGFATSRDRGSGR